MLSFTGIGGVVGQFVIQGALAVGEMYSIAALKGIQKSAVLANAVILPIIPVCFIKGLTNSLKYLAPLLITVEIIGSFYKKIFLLGLKGCINRLVVISTFILNISLLILIGLSIWYLISPNIYLAYILRITVGVYGISILLKSGLHIAYPQIVQTCFCVVVITSVTERVKVADMRRIFYIVSVYICHGVVAPF